jgi:hypothetical protein
MNARTHYLLWAAAGLLMAAAAPADADQPAAKKKCPFAGTYSGTYTFMSGNGDQEGLVTLMTIDDNGNITGESKDTSNDTITKIKGTVLKDSKVADVFEFPTGQKVTAFGTISKTAAGGLTGTLTQRVGTTAVGSIEFDLKPKSK